MNDTLKAIDAILLEMHDRIQSGRCLTTEQQNKHMLSFLNMIANKDEYVSKYEAAKYVGVSRPTFDRLVASGKLPQGKKRAGWKEIGWKKKDLDEYIEKYIFV